MRSIFRACAISVALSGCSTGPEHQGVAGSWLTVIHAGQAPGICEDLRMSLQQSGEQVDGAWSTTTCTGVPQLQGQVSGRAIGDSVDIALREFSYFAGRLDGNRLLGSLGGVQSAAFVRQ